MAGSSTNHSPELRAAILRDSFPNHPQSNSHPSGDFAHRNLSMAHTPWRHGSAASPPETWVTHLASSAEAKYPGLVFCTSRCWYIPCGKLFYNHGKSPFLLGKLTISMAMFNSKLLVYQRGIILKKMGPQTRTWSIWIESKIEQKWKAHASRTRIFGSTGHLIPGKDLL